MASLDVLSSQYSPSANTVTVTGTAGAGVTVRALVNPDLGGHTTAEAIFDNYLSIPALARGEGTGVNFSIVMTVPAGGRPDRVCVVIREGKVERPPLARVR